VKHLLLSFFTFGAAFSFSQAFAANLEFSSLKGIWKVTAVAVPNEGVQALVENDPQYMGAIVEFGTNNITWTKGTKTKPIDPSSDNCVATPTLRSWVADPDFPNEAPVKGGFTVMCADSEWGTVLPENKKTMKLYWYDNGILTLTKE